MSNSYVEKLSFVCCAFFCEYLLEWTGPGSLLPLARFSCFNLFYPDSFVNTYLTVLKCKDHYNHYEYCHSFPSLPIVINPLPSLPSLSVGSDMKQRKGATNILYGMDSGALSSVTVQPDGTHTHLWTVEEAAKRSPVTCTYSALCDLCHVEGQHSHINCRLSSKLYSYYFYAFSFSLFLFFFFFFILFREELLCFPVIFKRVWIKQSKLRKWADEPITDEHDT